MPAPTATDAAAPVRRLGVSEIFGPTFQGEGPSLGRRCSFVRLVGCNLECGFCDTPFTWDYTGKNGRAYRAKDEITVLTPDEIMADLAERGADTLIVSGGEPLLQQKALVPLLEQARAAGWWVEVETAGTIAPSPALVRLVSQFNVSPKLANSGNAPDRRYRPAALAALQGTGTAAWKFVATGPGDLDEVQRIVDAHRLDPVYIMPEGTSAEQVARHGADLADAVLARGWRMTTRLHILLWGDERGV